MDNETYLWENDRRYIQPTLSRDEQLGFVNTLRDTMGRNTNQINTQTHNLGTDIPSNLGGLTGTKSYFNQRYQTIPLESQANTLKAAAQAKALNDLMSNYENQMKNRANQAYRAASRRASSGSGGGSADGEVEYEDPTETTPYETSADMIMPTAGWPEGVSVTGYGTINNERFYKNADTGEILYTDSSNYAQDSNGIYRYIANWRANSRYDGFSNRQLADLTAAGKQPVSTSSVSALGGGGW